MDTKTASLNLDVAVSLVPIAVPAAAAEIPYPLTHESQSTGPLMQLLVRVAITVIGGVLLRILTRERVTRA